jgi:outer membrane autotransporter protein
MTVMPGGGTDMGFLRSGTIAALLAFVTLPVQAQVQQGRTDSGLSGVQASATARTIVTSAHQIASGVQRAVEQRLIEPRGFSAGPAALNFAADEVSAAPAAIREGRSADVAPLLWNVWGDANLSWIDRDHPLFGNDGHLVTSSLGLDRRFGDRAVLGVIVNGELSDINTTFNSGSLDTSGAGLGAYGGYALTQRVVVDALVLWKDFDNDVRSLASSGSYRSERWIAAANITGYLDLAALRVAPSAGILHSREEQDAYTDTSGAFAAGADIETTVLSFGSKAEYAVDMGAGRIVTPWIGAAAEWEVAASAGALVGGARDDREDVDLRLSSGLNAQLSHRISMSVKADVAGLTRSDDTVVTAGGQLAIRF